MERRMWVRGGVVVVAGSMLLGAPVLLRSALGSSGSPAETAPDVGAVRVHGDTERVQIGSTSPTRTWMRNVDFRVGDGVVLRIRTLDGALRALGRDVVDFDDRTSY